MKAVSLNTGDAFRYRGKRYTCHGTCKVYVPKSVIAVIAIPKGQKYVIGKGKWMRIPGDHTVVLENQTR